MVSLRILVDTNVIIALEDDRKVDEVTTTFYREASKNGIILVHPKTIEDVNRDKNSQRLEKTLSKTLKYETLEDAPEPDQEFLERIGVNNNPNDLVDSSLLFALYRKCVSFLVTEDNGIRKKAKILDLQEQVLTIQQASELFTVLSYRELPKHPLVQSVPVYALNLRDPFFDSLREAYPEFDQWFGRISAQGRKSWVMLDKGMIQAICIYNEEREHSDSPQIPLPTLKLNTLKISERYSGKKISELLLKMAFKYVIDNNLKSLYLTMFPDNFSLRYVIEDFGFTDVGQKGSEIIYAKKMLRPTEVPKGMNAVNYAIEFYPNFLDDSRISKFIVPIRPVFHDRLFPDCPGQQQQIPTDLTHLPPEGNTIKKAYICNSKTNKIREGNVLLFYRSHDRKEITSIGVVEKTIRSKDPIEIASVVSNRTVYNLEEIKELASRTALVLIFRHQKYLNKTVTMEQLEKKHKILGPIQSIREITHKEYEEILRGKK